MDESKNPAGTAATTPEPPRKVRRVGTLAFALLLIAAGVLLLLQQFVPGFDLYAIVKFAPVLLIVLGVEMLVYTARPGVKVKFDWLSVLGCGFILVIVGGASMVPLVWSYVNPARDYARNNYNTQLQNQVYQALSQDPELKARINSLYVSVWFNHTDSGEYTLQDVDDVNLNVELAAHSYADAQTFAADCYRITQLVQQAGVPVDQYQFDASNMSEADGNRYSLNFLTSFFEGLSPEQLAQRVDCYYYYQGNSYATKADRDNAVKAILREEVIGDFANEHDGEYPGDEYVAQEVENRFNALFPAPEAPAATPETAA